MAERLTEKEIYLFVDSGAAEDLSLDFKNSASLTNKPELCKDVAAFANSAGGRIIYGIDESKVNDDTLGKAIGFSPIDHNEADAATARLQQVLSTGVNPRVDGVLIYEVPLKERFPGKSAVVVEVPQSLRTPHQVTESRKFPKRNGKVTDFCFEYEIRDLYRRNEIPDLRVSIEPEYSWVDFTSNAAGTYAKGIDFHLNIINRSSVPVEYAIVRLLIEPQLFKPAIRYAGQIRPTRNAHDDAWLQIPEEFVPVRPLRNHQHKELVRNWHVRKDMPLFGGELFQLSAQPFTLHIPSQAQTVPRIEWGIQIELMAAKMPFRMYDGQIYLKTGNLYFDLGEDIITEEPASNEEESV